MKATEITKTFFATSTGYKTPMNGGDLLTCISYNDKTEDNAKADDRIQLWCNTDKSDEVYWLYVGQHTPLFNVVQGIKVNEDKGILYSRTISHGREHLIKGTPQRITALYKALARMELKRYVKCEKVTEKEFKQALKGIGDKATTPKKATKQGATA